MIREIAVFGKLLAIHPVIRMGSRRSGWEVNMKRTLKYAAMIALLAAVAAGTAATASAHVHVTIGIGVGPAAVYVGPPPVCAYGYFPYAPYACAPYGYYGPEWFVGGAFIGAGPWFHGFYGPEFYGRRHFDFRDRAWVDFHDHDGWRHYRDGDRWRDGFDRDARDRGDRRDFRDDHRDGGNHFGDRRDFRDAPAYRGREGFHRFQGGDDHRQATFHGDRGYRGGNAAFRGHRGFRGDRGNHGNDAHGHGFRGRGHGHDRGGHRGDR